MTRTTQDATFRLGLTSDDVVQVVQSMKRGRFCMSMTSFDAHRVWENVYHVPWEDLVLYVKPTVDELGRL